MGSASIIGLQEVKIDNWGMRRWLENLRKEGTVVFDNPHGTKGGTALILHRSVQVVQLGTGGNGRLAWAKIQLGDEQVGIMTIHAPNKRRVRMEFWSQVQEIMGDKKWCIFGDFNQVELGKEDSVGKLALIRGREERLWRTRDSRWIKDWLILSFVLRLLRGEELEWGGHRSRTTRLWKSLTPSLAWKLKPEEIMEEVHSFYQDLFTADATRKARRAVQQEILDLIQVRLTLEESEQAAAIPDKEESEATVFGIKTNKSPVYDWFTI
ncbi:hypothetical protein R1sor_018864 [Riccia sorocarpa]|uniref:Endonuclease/exonuclease/phosphatase domain-containing protein n=1 Tax=Riccia sorocarpa TaxID=122646 RepID=A0ABD3IF46_9MARC